MDNSLFTFVSQDVKDEIGRRVHILNNYSPSSINQQHGKVAFATVKGGNIILGTYQSNDKLYSKNNNYLPHAALKDVKITNEGQFGSLRKATFNYTVYNKNQLDYYEKAFMIPGRPIEIFYGWSNSHSNTNVSKFKGLIYNFSYNVTDDGSFDCAGEAVGEGYFISALNLNSEIKNDNEIKDEKDSTLLVNNIFTLIDSNIKKALKDGDTDYYPDYHLAKFSNIKESSNKDKLNQQNEQAWYIELYGLINLINDNLLNDSPVKLTINAISYYDRYIKSADPSVIVFPDKYMGKYSDKFTYEINSNFKLEEPPMVYKNPEKEMTVDIGKVLISVNLINRIIDDNNFNNGSKGLLLKPFLDKIFSIIKDNSGGYYNLILMTTVNDANVEDLVIVEVNYLSIPPDVNYDDKILTFAPFTKNSIVKSYSLSAALPDTMATAMYLNNSSDINEKVKNLFLGNDISPDQNSVDNEEINYDSINKQLNTNNFSQIFTNSLLELSVNTKTFETFKLVDNIEKAANNVAISQDATSVQSLKTALFTYVNKNEDSPMSNTILLPLTLSLSIEGINGLKFGNIITSTYLPTKYIKHKNKIIFIITKLTDSISDNDWTTDIETQCTLLNN